MTYEIIIGLTGIMNILKKYTAKIDCLVIYSV